VRVDGFTAAPSDALIGVATQDDGAITLCEELAAESGRQAGRHRPA
jgi:hypothetical protein